MKIARVPVEMIVPDPEQPRKLFDPIRDEEFKQNIQRVGQQVPLILFPFEEEKKWMIGDGERRWWALTAAGIREALAILLPERPTKAKLRIIQASIDVHRVSFNPMERSNNLAEIQRETGWTVTEMAEQLSIKQSLCSKLLSYQKLGVELQVLLATGSLEMEKGYLLSQLDHEGQLAMLKEFAHLSREELAVKIRAKGKSASVVKTKRAVLALPGGASITFKGDEVTLEELIERMTETLKRLKKGLADGLTAVTVAKMFQDKVR